jgi:hypothetical protein
LALAAALAGCGGDGGGDSSASADLARFAPAGTDAFGQIAVRPEGSLRESIDSILNRVPGGDTVGDKLIASLNESLAEDDLTYEENIEPWLGEHVGGFVSQLRFNSKGDLDLADADAALIVETTDEDRAREELLKQEKADGPVRESSYKGVQILDQYAGKSPGAFAVFDGVVVGGGGPGAVRAAIDASQGENLSDDADLSAFLDAREGDNMAVGYLDPGEVLNAVERGGLLSANQVDSIGRAFGSTLDQPFLSAFDVSSGKLVLDFASGAREATGFSLKESSLIDDLPSQAWLALGFGDVGGYVDNLSTQLESIGGRGLSIGQLNRIMQRQAGISLDDLRGLGDAAFFASGESILQVQVGAVFEVSSDAARSHLLAAIARAVTRSGEARLGQLGISDAEGFSVLVPGIPVPINVATRDDRLVIAVGTTPTEALLSGEGSSEAVDAARDALGGDDFAVDLALRIQPVLDLVDSTGGSDDPDFNTARPYLDQITTIAAGTRTQNDQSLFRILVELTD